jgi:phosphinothricin acetyltransferase
VLIRRATHADLEEITSIYNEVITNTDAIYRETAVPELERTAWFEAKVSDGYPVLVACEADQVVGYGVYGNFRFGEGYNHTVEHSVHVRSDSRGQGFGKAMLAELIRIATSEKRHVMVAAIDSKNLGSISLHALYGFIETARMPEVAKKNDICLTLVLMQKILSSETPLP